MDALAKDTDFIRRLVDFTGLAPAQVAKRAGISASTINRPLNGVATTRLGRNVLDKLRRAFPEFHGWEGYFDAFAVADRHSPYRAPPREAVALPDGELVEIAQINLRHGLGAVRGGDAGEAETQVFSRSWLDHFTHADAAHLLWAIADGDSMEPTIRHGELLLIDSAQSMPGMSGGIWVVKVGGFVMVKRVHYAGPDGVQLASDNPLIPPISVARDDLRCIGRVVATMRKL